MQKEQKTSTTPSPAETQPCQPCERKLPNGVVNTLAALSLGGLVAMGMFVAAGGICHTPGASRSAQLEWQELQDEAASELASLAGDQ